MGREEAGYPAEQHEPLLPGVTSLFAGDRPARESVWKWLWIVALVGATVGAVYAAQNT